MQFMDSLAIFEATSDNVTLFRLFHIGQRRKSIIYFLYMKNNNFLLAFQGHVLDVGWVFDLEVATRSAPHVLNFV